MAYANPHGQTALRENINGCELLGKQDRLPLRQHDHANPEANPRRHGGEIGKRGQRFEAWLIFALRGKRDVIADPKGLKSRLLAAVRLPRKRIGVGRLIPLWSE